MTEEAKKKLLGLPDVIALTDQSRAAIYASMAAGTFPKSVKLSAQRVAWVQGEILAWIDARIAARDAKTQTKKAG